MAGRFGPGCCCVSGYCVGDPTWAGAPSEVLVDFDTVDFNTDTQWVRSVSGLDSQITETFNGSTAHVLFVDSPMITLNTTAGIGYTRGSLYAPPAGIIPTGDRPFVLAELEFTMTGALDYSFNNGFSWFATTVAGFSTCGKAAAYSRFDTKRATTTHSWAARTSRECTGCAWLGMNSVSSLALPQSRS